MADSVQSIMEGMAVELNLLAKSGIFTKNEIRSIVRHRERFEFRVHRSQPSKLDYLRYIQYEQKLQQLRSRRLKRLNKIVNPMISTGGLHHIQGIFQRALLKFPTDLSLWASYVGFCRTHSLMRAASNALGRALCALPNEPRLWIFAANWEFKNNTNISNARNIFQRAIRVNPLSRELYIEYARFELSILSKVKEGKDENVKETEIENVTTENGMEGGEEEGDDDEKVKIENDSDDDEDDVNENDEGKKASLDIDSLPLPKKESDENVKEEDDEKEEVDEKDIAFLSGEIPRLLFSQACKKLPTDFALRSEFAKLLHEFKIAYDADNLLRSELISDLTVNFPNSVEAHSVLIELSSPKSNDDDDEDGNESVIAKEEEELEKIVRSNPSKDNWEKFILHKVSIYQKYSSNGKLSVENAKKISSLCDEIDTSKFISERIYELWLTIAASTLADEKLALDVAKRAIVGSPGSVKMWRAHIALLTRSGATSDVICTELRHAAESVEGELVKYQFWVDIVKRRIDQDKYSLDKVMRTVTAAVESLCSVRVATSGDAGAFAPICYELVRERFARKGARKVVALFLKRTPCCSVEFCMKVLDAEEPGKDVAYIRDLYRIVLGPTCLGKIAPELWVRYHSFEQDLGNMREAANVYQRARTILDNPSAFLDSFSGI